jgi:hypothetical protein
MYGGEIDQFDTAWIGDDQRGAVLPDRFLDLQTQYGMGFRRVGPDCQNRLSLDDVRNRVCHCTAAEGLHEA